MTLRRLFSTRPFVSRLALIVIGTGAAATLMILAVPAQSFGGAPRGTCNSFASSSAPARHRPDTTQPAVHPHEQRSAPHGEALGSVSSGRCASSTNRFASISI
jgi:hypothetical protein